jgi:hypothetical protein
MDPRAAERDDCIACIEERIHFELETIKCLGDTTKELSYAVVAAIGAAHPGIRVDDPFDVRVDQLPWRFTSAVVLVE